MRKILTVILLCFASSQLHAQGSSGALTILLGGSAGKFNIDAGGNFNSIYSNKSLIYTEVFGLGNGGIFIVGKYRAFTLSGDQGGSNAAATASAEWKQRMLSTGLRFGPGGSAIYLDALYVFNHVEESIGTMDPTANALTGNQKIDQNGIAFALGLSPRLAGPLDLNLEAEYSFKIRTSTLQNGLDAPDLGGLYLSAGLSFYLNL